MLIRNYNKKDILCIEQLGKLLHNNYEFNINEYTKCLVALEKDKLIGFITYTVMYEKSEIIDIIIDPLYRKKGNGKKLLNYVIEELIKENIENITLEVNSNNNAAIALYKLCGFKIATTRKKYYGNDDAYLMIKELR